MSNTTLVLYVLAIVCFLLSAMGVTRPTLVWRDVAFALLTLSLIWK